MIAYLVAFVYLKDSVDGPKVVRGTLIVEAKGEADATKVASEKLKAYGPTVRVKKVRPW